MVVVSYWPSPLGLKESGPSATFVTRVGSCAADMANSAGVETGAAMVAGPPVPVGAVTVVLLTGPIVPVLTALCGVVAAVNVVSAALGALFGVGAGLAFAGLTVDRKLMLRR